MIEVELPDGSIAEFPDGTPEGVMKTALMKHTQGSLPGIGEDIAKSGASGFARGVADLAGLPGTIGDALKSGGQWALRNAPRVFGGEEAQPGTFLGGPTPEIEAMMIGGGSNPLGGENLRAALSSLTGGATDYQPQTTAGEYARTAGEFAPAAVAGPGGLLRKAAMTAVPAVASETAGQLTEGTALEPWARAGGALAGGLASAGRVNPTTVAAKGAPTREALKQTTDDLYGALRDAGIKYDSKAFSDTISDVYGEFRKQGFRPGLSEGTERAFRLADELRQETGQLDFDAINAMVVRVGGAARDSAAKGDNTAAKAFGIIRDKLDDFERASPLTAPASLTPNQINSARSLARQTALKNIKQRALDEVAKNAETYQSGVEAGIRNGVGNLLRSKKGQQLFTGEERTSLLQVAQGRKGLRTLSRFGLDLTSLGGNATLLPTLGAVGAGGLLGVPAGAALPVLGTAAKIASPRLTQRALDQTSAAIRSGGLTSAAGREATQKLRNDQLLRRLLGGQMGLTASQVPVE